MCFEIFLDDQKLFHSEICASKFFQSVHAQAWDIISVLDDIAYSTKELYIMINSLYSKLEQEKIHIFTFSDSINFNQILLMLYKSFYHKKSEVKVEGYSLICRILQKIVSEPDFLAQSA